MCDTGVGTLKMIGVVDLQDGLYAMKLNDLRRILSAKSTPKPVCLQPCTLNMNSNILDLWHVRLGHLPLNKMLILHKKFRSISCTNLNNHYEHGIEQK